MVNICLCPHSHKWTIQQQIHMLPELCILEVWWMVWIWFLFILIQNHMHYFHKSALSYRNFEGPITDPWITFPVVPPMTTKYFVGWPFRFTKQYALWISFITLKTRRENKVLYFYYSNTTAVCSPHTDHHSSWFHISVPKGRAVISSPSR